MGPLVGHDPLGSLANCVRLRTVQALDALAGVGGYGVGHLERLSGVARENRVRQAQSHLVVLRHPHVVEREFLPTVSVPVEQGERRQIRQAAGIERLIVGQLHAAPHHVPCDQPRLPAGLGGKPLLERLHHVAVRVTEPVTRLPGVGVLNLPPRTICDGGGHHQLHGVLHDRHGRRLMLVAVVHDYGEAADRRHDGPVRVQSFVEVHHHFRLRVGAPRNPQGGGVQRRGSPVIERVRVETLERPHGDAAGVLERGGARLRVGHQRRLLRAHHRGQPDPDLLTNDLRRLRTTLYDAEFAVQICRGHREGAPRWLGVLVQRPVEPHPQVIPPHLRSHWQGRRRPTRLVRHRQVDERRRLFAVRILQVRIVRIRFRTAGIIRVRDGVVVPMQLVGQRDRLAGAEGSAQRQHHIVVVGAGHPNHRRVMEGVAVAAADSADAARAHHAELERQRGGNRRVQCPVVGHGQRPAVHTRAGRTRPRVVRRLAAVDLDIRAFEYAAGLRQAAHFPHSGRARWVEARLDDGAFIVRIVRCEQHLVAVRGHLHPQPVDVAVAAPHRRIPTVAAGSHRVRETQRPAAVEHAGGGVQGDRPLAVGQRVVVRSQVQAQPHGAVDLDRLGVLDVDEDLVAPDVGVVPSVAVRVVGRRGDDPHQVDRRGVPVVAR